jgi:hypothetical protein
VVEKVTVESVYVVVVRPLTVPRLTYGPPAPVLERRIS